MDTSNEVTARQGVPPPDPAARARFEAVINQRYPELLAYARRQLGEPWVRRLIETDEAKEAAEEEGHRQYPTRFAADECVANAVADLLRDGRYSTCATDFDTFKYVVRTITFRLKREYKQRGLRRRRELPLPAMRDDVWDPEATQQSAWHGGRDGHKFPEQAIIDDPTASHPARLLASGIPRASQPARLKARIEAALAARIDVALAVDDAAAVHEAAVLLIVEYFVAGYSIIEIADAICRRDGREHLRSARVHLLRGIAADCRDRLRKHLVDYRPNPAGLAHDTRAADTAYRRRWSADVRAEFRRALGRRRALLVSPRLEFQREWPERRATPRKDFAVA